MVNNFYRIYEYESTETNLSITDQPKMTAIIPRVKFMVHKTILPDTTNAKQIL